MKSSNPVRFGYVISQETSPGSHYAHLTISLSPMGNRYAGDFSATLRFQTDSELRDGKRSGWYGLQISVSARNSSDLASLAKIISRLEKTLIDRKGEDGQDAEFALRKMNPANICWALESMKIPRCVYDARISEQVAIADLADLSFSRWGNQFVNVIAGSEKDARKLALKEMANSRYVSTEEIKSWMENGLPMRQDTYSPSPSFSPDLETALALPFHTGIECAAGY